MFISLVDFLILNTLSFRYLGLEHFSMLSNDLVFSCVSDIIVLFYLNLQLLTHLTFKKCPNL